MSFKALIQEKHFSPRLRLSNEEATDTTIHTYDPLQIEREWLQDRKEEEMWPQQYLFELNRCFVFDLTAAQHVGFNLVEAYYQDRQSLEMSLYGRIRDAFDAEFPEKETKKELSRGLNVLGNITGAEFGTGQDILYQEFMQNVYTLASLYMCLLRRKFNYLNCDSSHTMETSTHNDFTSLDLLEKFRDFVKGRIEQDNHRFATRKDSPMRICNYYDRAIKAVNSAFGIETYFDPDSPNDPYQMRFENVKRVIG